ncbi:hypothetical protein JZ751_024197 [Albula glossodonta]|uniref:C2H2-type domain-containing protein n=1 Tax=Albula glossodonta TaxID=121402 RepID=A0A8T2MQV1_9TELE|nr:hypothetical protein JZ751_024197 [Albula glossodonta]
MAAAATCGPDQITSVTPESDGHPGVTWQHRLGEGETEWERDRERDGEKERDWDWERGTDSIFEWEREIEREREWKKVIERERERQIERDSGIGAERERISSAPQPAGLCIAPTRCVTRPSAPSTNCSDHLKNHLQTHDPNKEAYHCSECGKSYSTKLGYKRHSAMHAAAAGDLTCKVCLQHLETTPALLEHLRGHSGGAGGGAGAAGVVKEKKHPCSHCERRFYTRKDVRRHMVVHTGRKDFLCQFCAQRFGRKDHLTRHAKKSHSQELAKGRGAETQGVASPSPQGILGAASPPHLGAIKEELNPPPPPSYTQLRWWLPLPDGRGFGDGNGLSHGAPSPPPPKPPPPPPPTPDTITCTPPPPPHHSPTSTTRPYLDLPHT